MGVPSNLENAMYYGKGPWENYIDRSRSAEIGDYAIATKDLFHNYAMPQENGNRSEVSWFSLTSKNKTGINIKGNQKLSFSVWPYSLNDIRNNFV